MRADFPPGSLPDGLLDRIRVSRAERPFSLMAEIRALLALGVLCLSAGLGVLAYKNLDTLGHRAILAAIALGACACLFRCFRRAPAFAWGRVPEPGAGTGYALWLGALLTGTFVGYLQARYAAFGSHTAAAVALPGAFYLFLAYRFDHRGVLQLGISGLCAAAGVAATPAEMLRAGPFVAHPPVPTGLVLAAACGAAAWLSGRRGLKPHFAFSYGNFAAHLFFLSALAGLLHGRGFGEAFHFLLATAGACGLFAFARRRRSAYFVLAATAYGYIAITAMAYRHLFARGWAFAELGFLYFLLSCGGAIRLFLNLKGLAGGPRGEGTDDAGV